MFFISFSFAALNAASIALVMPNIFKISNNAGVKFKRGKSLKSKNTPLASTTGLIIIEKTGLGACVAILMLREKGNCPLFIIVPSMKSMHIKIKTSGFKPAKEYKPRELMLLYPRVGIVIVSAVIVEKYKNAQQAQSIIKSAVIFVIKTFLEFSCDIGF